MEQRISINYSSKCVRVWHGGRNAEQSYFSSKEFGSLYSAYRAARAFEKELPAKQRAGRVKARLNPFPYSQSGIVGVCPFKSRTGEQAGWRANWTQEVDGKRRPKTKDFSFFSYGRNALELAIECRRQMVLEHYPAGE